MLFSQRSEHVDGFGVPGVLDGAVGSVFGGAELDARLGGWCWRRILRVVAWCREPVRRAVCRVGRWMRGK